MGRAPESGEPSLDPVGLARSEIRFTVEASKSESRAVGGGIADRRGALTLASGVTTAHLARERFGVDEIAKASHLASLSFCPWLALVMLQAIGSWRDFRRVLKRPKLIDEARFSRRVTRAQHAEAAVATLGPALASRPRTE